MLAQALFSVLDVNLKDKFSPVAAQIKLVWFCMVIKTFVEKSSRIFDDN